MGDCSNRLAEIHEPLKKGKAVDIDLAVEAVGPAAACPSGNAVPPLPNPQGLNRDTRESCGNSGPETALLNCF